MDQEDTGKRRKRGSRGKGRKYRRTSERATERLRKVLRHHVAKAIGEGARPEHVLTMIRAELGGVA